MQISMILCLGNPTLAIPAMLEDFAARWPGLPAATEVSQDGDTTTFTLGDSQFALAVMPAAVPWSDLEGPCATSVLWKDAATAVRAHDHHVLVTAFGEDHAVDESYLLTAVTAALMATTAQAIGAYWCNATLVVPKALFVEMATTLVPDGLPLPLWVDFRVGWNEGRTSSRGFTSGLAALGLMDLEADAASEPPVELKKRFEGIAAYLIQHGLVIKDRDTLGETANEKIRVVYGPSSFGANGQVMRLSYESTASAPAAGPASTPAPARKPWWKLF